MGRVPRVVRGTHLQMQVQGSASCPVSRVSAFVPGIGNWIHLPISITGFRGPPITLIVPEAA